VDGQHRNVPVDNGQGGQQPQREFALQRQNLAWGWGWNRQTVGGGVIQIAVGNVEFEPGVGPSHVPGDLQRAGRVNQSRPEPERGHPTQAGIELVEISRAGVQSHGGIEPVGAAAIQGQGPAIGQIVEQAGQVTGFPAAGGQVKGAGQPLQVDDRFDRSGFEVIAAQVIGGESQMAGQRVDQRLKNGIVEGCAPFQPGQPGLKYRAGLVQGGRFGQGGLQLGQDGQVVAAGLGAPHLDGFRGAAQ